MSSPAIGAMACLGPGAGQIGELLGVGRRHLDAVLGEGRLQLGELAQALRLHRGAHVLARLGQDLAAEAAEGAAELEEPRDIGLAAGRRAPCRCWRRLPADDGLGHFLLHRTAP